MNEVILLSVALVASGIYITYLQWRLARLRKWAAMASFALEAALETLLERADDDTDSE